MASRETAAGPPIFIPMRAEDVERKRRRKFIVIGGIAAIALITVVYGWKLRTDPIVARESFDSGERLLSAQRYNEAALVGAACVFRGGPRGRDWWLCGLTPGRRSLSVSSMAVDSL